MMLIFESHENVSVTARMSKEAVRMRVANAFKNHDQYRAVRSLYISRMLACIGVMYVSKFY